MDKLVRKAFLLSNDSETKYPDKLTVAMHATVLIGSLIINKSLKVTYPLNINQYLCKK